MEEVATMPNLVPKGPILITGGITGIGRATVDLLSEMGVTVYATARKDKDFRELAEIKHMSPQSNWMSPGRRMLRESSNPSGTGARASTGS